jgi:hypothetical protein
MLSLILAIALNLQATNATPAIVPPKEVQEMVRPILDLCAQGEALQGEHQDGAWQAAKLTGALLRSRTKSSDEALVVLMTFYIGESTGNDLRHQVTVRGERMLRLLLKYRAAQLAFSARKYPIALLLPADVREADFDEVIKSVREGKVLGED